MATITPNEALSIVDEKLLADTSNDLEVFQVAVGDGTTAVSEFNTQLDNELYRANKTFSNLDIVDVSTEGEFDARITISGGTEVPAGTTLTEFGIFLCDPADPPPDDTEDAKDTLLHREVRSGVTLESGDRKTFEITFKTDSK